MRCVPIRFVNVLHKGGDRVKRIIVLLVIMIVTLSFNTVAQAKDEDKSKSVRILTPKKVGEDRTLYRFTGSGFFIEGGYVITAAHVVKNETEFYIDGINNEYFSAVLVKVDHSKDLAMLKTSSVSHAYYELASNVSDKETVTLIGNHGNDHFVTSKCEVIDADEFIPIAEKGIISSSENRIELKGDVRDGYSGGPIYNANGKIVGVTVAGDGERVVGVKLEHLKEFVESAEKK